MLSYFPHPRFRLVPDYFLSANSATSPSQFKETHEQVQAAYQCNKSLSNNFAAEIKIPFGTDPDKLFY